MSSFANVRQNRLLRDQRGQVLPWAALLMVVFLGMAGITVDLGHAYECYRQLQASTDAATLAGAYAMTLSGATSTTVGNQVKAYSSLMTGAGTTSGRGANADGTLTNVSLQTPTLKCVDPTTSSYVDVPCSASPTNNNVIRVTQSAVIPMYFIGALRAFGNSTATSITLNTTSSAAIMSGSNTAQNIAIVMDTTASMNTNDNDANCGHTRIYCALQGMQTLMKSLSPCSTGSTSSNCVGPYDQVSLFTFPNIQANQASNDTTCPSSNPTIPKYSYVPIPSTTNTTWTAPTGTSATYQVTDYLDNYSSTNAANGALAGSTALGVASGAGTCNGLQAPGGDGTYIASAMYAAITSLQAEKAANPLSSNAIVLLSDGASSSSKFDSNFISQAATYPSTVDQCTQMVNAGKYATQLGITVYTVAYGASNSNSDCGTDTGSYATTPCAALAATASTAADFYSDATAQANKGQCTSSSNPNLNLNGIFGSIANKFTAARLVPNTV